MTSRTKIIAAGLSAFSFCALNCQAFADPLASSSFTRKSGFSESTQINDTHNVQLLVDIKTGLELNQIRTLIPTAKVLEKSGKVFVYVTQTTNARTAYNLGKSLQDKFNIIFSLAYSEGHPDLNLAWMKPLSNSVATKPIPVRPIIKPSLKEASPSSEVSKPVYVTKDTQSVSPLEKAVSINSQRSLSDDMPIVELTQNTNFAEPVLVESYLARVPNKINHPSDLLIDKKLDASNINVSHSLETSSSSIVNHSNKTNKRKSISETLKELRSINITRSYQDDLASANNNSEILDPLTIAESEELQYISSAVVDTHEELNQTVSSISEISSSASEVEPLKNDIGRNDLTTEPQVSNKMQKLKVQHITRKEGIKKIRQSLGSLSATSNSAVEEPIVKNKNLSQTSSLINSVAIRPSHIGDLPIHNSRFTAVNSELAYVYVEVKNESDASNVKQIKGVYGLQVRDGKLLARVGVYTQSKLGKRLLSQQLEQLEQKGWSVELALNYNSVNA